MTQPETQPQPPADLLREQHAARARIQGCLSQLLRQEPFYGAIAIHLIPPIPDYDRASIAADGQNFRYNPKWVIAASTAQLRNAVAHCVLACGLKHHTRRGSRTYPRWQKASRLVTQALLLEHKLADPEFGEGVRANVERVYEQLPPDLPQPGFILSAQPPGDEDPSQSPSSTIFIAVGPAPDADDPQQQQIPDQQRGSGQSGQSDSGSQQQDSQAPGHGPGQPAAGQPGNSSTSDGQHQPQAGLSGTSQQQQTNPDGTPKYDDPDQQGEVMDHPKAGPGSDEQAQRDAENQWDDIIQQSLQISRNQGNTPGNIAELIQRSQNPEIDWKDELAEFMNEHAPNELSWNHPDRRFIQHRIYLQGLHSSSMQSMCFAIDTSGSLNNPALSNVWSAISEICDELDPEYVRIIQCDTIVQDDEQYDKVDLPDEIIAKGRGGTSFRPVFELIDDEPPMFLIYLTDLHCDQYPVPEPDFPVLWIATSPRSPEPPFGRRLNLPPHMLV